MSDTMQTILVVGLQIVTLLMVIAIAFRVSDVIGRLKAKQAQEELEEEREKTPEYKAGRVVGYRYAMAAYEGDKDLGRFFDDQIDNIPEYRDGTIEFRDGFEDGVLNVWDRQDIERSANAG